uniref:Uncharacterized protein n=1 Tax=Cacopsylla melanoneura TaxID=428564 RepID=A0A8D8Z6D0_9HEMI
MPVSLLCDLCSLSLQHPSGFHCGFTPQFQYPYASWCLMTVYISSPSPVCSPLTLQGACCLHHIIHVPVYLQEVYFTIHLLILMILICLPSLFYFLTILFLPS